MSVRAPSPVRRWQGWPINTGSMVRGQCNSVGRPAGEGRQGSFYSDTWGLVPREWTWRIVSQRQVCWVGVPRDRLLTSHTRRCDDRKALSGISTPQSGGLCFTVDMQHGRATTGSCEGHEWGIRWISFQVGMSRIQRLFSTSPDQMLRHSLSNITLRDRPCQVRDRLACPSAWP
jgi:hypothetical protein